MVESPLLLLLHDSSLKDEPRRHASERVSDGHTWPEAFVWPSQWFAPVCSCTCLLETASLRPHWFTDSQI